MTRLGLAAGRAWIIIVENLYPIARTCGRMCRGRSLDTARKLGIVGRHCGLRPLYKFCKCLGLLYGDIARRRDMLHYRWLLGSGTGIRKGDKKGQDCYFRHKLKI